MLVAGNDAGQLQAAIERLGGARWFTASLRMALRNIERALSGLGASMKDNPGAPGLLAGTGKDDVHLVIVATGDRGLAGGFNSTIVRGARRRGRDGGAEQQRHREQGVGIAQDALPDLLLTTGEGFAEWLRDAGVPADRVAVLGGAESSESSAHPVASTWDRIDARAVPGGTILSVRVSPGARRSGPRRPIPKSRK